MDYVVLCPECRRRHVYFSHEIGTAAECAHCGTKFLLPAQPKRVLLKLVVLGLLAVAAGVVFVVLVLLGGDVSEAVDAYINKR